MHAGLKLLMAVVLPMKFALVVLAHSLVIGRVPSRTRKGSARRERAAMGGNVDSSQLAINVRHLRVTVFVWAEHNAKMVRVPKCRVGPVGLVVDSGIIVTMRMNASYWGAMRFIPMASARIQP